MDRKFVCLAAAVLMSLLQCSCSAQTGERAKVRDAYPVLSSGALASAELVELPSGVILRSGEVKITQKDLDAEIQKSPKNLWPELKRNLFFVLENKATRVLLVAEAENWARAEGRETEGSEDALIRAYLNSLAGEVSVTDDEVRKFYDDNKDMMGGADFEQVKNELKNYVVGQKRNDAAQARINTLSERFVVEVDAAWAAKQNSAASDNDVDRARASGKPFMVDFGAGGCRPCDMMAPILAALKKEYTGKAEILFIDVREQQILAARYGVQSIPVQVFFDKDGREVFRHVGFFSREQIEAKLAEAGVQ